MSYDKPERPINPFEPVEKDDRYGQAGRVKAIGYPLGKPTMFIDGRLLENYEYEAARGVMTGVGNATSNLTIQMLAVPYNRALYIPWVVMGTFGNFTEDIVASWQIWADNREIASGVAGAYRADTKIYIPMDSQVTFYARIVNAIGPVANRFYFYGVPLITFDTRPDVWEWGRGNNAANPAIGALNWP